MSRTPYFQFYPDDYLSSPGVTTCDLADEGVYIRLLSYSWKHDGCQLPDDMQYLKRLCKGVREERLRRVLSQFFVRIELETSKFYWRNLRLFTEFCKANGVSIKRSEAAKLRWDKEKQYAIAVNVHMQKGMQNDAIPEARSQKPYTINHTPEQFGRFWSVYPRKTAKAVALKAWVKINPENDLFEQIIRAVEQQKKSAQWKKDSGEFIPHAATWLNQRRWEDEAPRREFIV
jgi:uncharacterized protein YdaU (DUF1376 family)